MTVPDRIGQTSSGNVSAPAAGTAIPAMAAAATATSKKRRRIRFSSPPRFCRSFETPVDGRMVAGIPDAVLPPESSDMGMRPFVRVLLRRAETERDVWRSRAARRDVAMFHEFHAPPYGGGNQFLRALRSELGRRGLAVQVNRLSGGTPACFYNSFNFDFTRLR